MLILQRFRSIQEKSSSWVATAKQVADKGMAHCHLAIYSKVLDQPTNQSSPVHEKLIQISLAS